MDNFVLMTGTANVPLAQNVASLLQTRLGNVEITRFIDSECRVQVKEDVKGARVFVMQSLSQIADQHVVELCLIAEALKHLEAGHITAVIPFMGYSKQDKEFRKGEAVSSHLMAKFIEAAGFDEIITVELHSENLLPYFAIPLNELSTDELLASEVQKRLMSAQPIVASPDKGGRLRSDRFARTLGAPIVFLSKKRDLSTGNVTVNSISGSVHGKHVVIYDDIINTGATAIETSRFLTSQGANSIWYVATHAVLAGDAAQKLTESSIHEVIVTDTIFIPKEKQFPRLSIVSVAPFLADAIASKMK